MRFYARSAQDWLALEVPGVSVDLSEPDRLQLGDQFELRLLRDDCRWQLYRRHGRSWRRYQPSRPCTSLVDWLAQVRKVYTYV